MAVVLNEDDRSARRWESTGGRAAYQSRGRAERGTRDAPRAARPQLLVCTVALPINNLKLINLGGCVNMWLRTEGATVLIVGDSVSRGLVP